MAHNTGNIAGFSIGADNTTFKQHLEIKEQNRAAERETHFEEIQYVRTHRQTINKLQESVDVGLRCMNIENNGMKTCHMI